MAVSRKTKTAFFCSQCGAQHPRWQGQCRECGEWNVLVEEKLPDKRGPAAKTGPVEAVPLPEVSTETLSGLTSGINEFDRVLGGHLLPGMTVLLGGEPGIGKSTLLLQAAEAYSRQGLKVLYATGEESPSQLKMRAERLAVTGHWISVLSSVSLEEILAAVSQEPYAVVLVDSIQTVASAQFDSPAGTVAQVRESANQLIAQAKARGTSLILVGHVTKDGMVAGPKVLEHMVDTVIYFEGDSSQLFRMLRATKNRFGSIAEIGLFEMAAAGLVEVANPSSLFISERAGEARIGSVVAPICEGSRPLLVEVQALVARANYGSPQRVAGGLDNKRLALLLAVLEKRCDYPMSTNDVFVSIAGGLRLSEPAIDLPVLLAIASSHLNRPLDPTLAAAGEVGLSGEVRGVAMAERRVGEAARLGFKRMLLPRSNASVETPGGIEVVGVSSLGQALEVGLD